MADAEKSDDTQNKQDSGSESGKDAQQQSKTFDEAEVKKIIEERDKAKAKLRKIDEDARKAEEEAALARGEHEKVIASQREKLEALEKFKAQKDAEEQAERDSLLAKLSDDDKEIASDLSTAKLRAYVEKQSKQKASALNTKGAAADTEQGSVDILPGEKPADYLARMQKIGKAR